MQEPLFHKVVLGEIAGKNKAIHVYDDIMWKIRSGFLTLLLGGWAIVYLAPLVLVFLGVSVVLR